MDKLKNDKYIIFLDIDGTVMVNNAVPELDVKAIDKARELGHKVFINTGRAYGFFPKELQEALEYDGVVCGLGSYIRIGDEVIYSSVLSCEVIHTIVNEMYDKGLMILLEGEKRNIFMLKKDGEDKGAYTPETLPDEVLLDSRINKITFGVLNDEQEKYLSQYVTVFRHPNYSEVAQKGCSKSNGMKQVLEYYGTDISHCIAMGDSLNDSDMLGAAGISVAMGNAVDYIKSICDYVSVDADKGGVAVAIMKFIPEVADALKSN